MWTKTEKRYQIVQIDLRHPLEQVTVPQGASGIAFVPRSNGRPVGFFMEEHPEGTVIRPRDLAVKLFQWCGRQILAEKIYDELRWRLDCAGFPQLDISICTHGRPDALKRCLQSLDDLGLTGAIGGTRVIVVDNAPNDDRTAQVVHSFPGVKYVVEPKPGLDFARNRAIQEGSADLLAFLDDDVIVDACWLQGLREAWAANPDAAAFTGPILPYELETRAQIAFERMGGFGKNFDRVRFGRALPRIPTYPVGAGMFGAGANMVFRRSVLKQLGGFDDALDTGAPLAGGGDLDIFYRVVQAGYPLVREPALVVYHQHRREYAKLRHQMWTWGLGTMAYITKSWRADPADRPKIRRWLLWWASYQLSKILVPFLRRTQERWPWDMVLAEMCGAVIGLWGEYDRSLARVEKVRRQFA
jgi:GT2 family glycosyltransferase